MAHVPSDARGQEMVRTPCSLGSMFQDTRDVVTYESVMDLICETTDASVQPHPLPEKWITRTIQDGITTAAYTLGLQTGITGNYKAVCNVRRAVEEGKGMTGRKENYNSRRAQIQRNEKMTLYLI